MCVNYVTDERAAAAVVTDIVERGGHAIAAQADVSRAADVDRLFTRWTSGSAASTRW